MDDLYIAVTDALADGGLDALADLQRALNLVPADMLRTALVARQQEAELKKGGVLDARAYVEQGRPVHYWTPIPPGSLIKVTDTPHKGWHEGVTFYVVSGGGYILQTIPQVDDLEGIGLPLSATIDLTKETAEIVRLGPDAADEGISADDDDGPGWKPSTEYAAHPHITDRTPNYIRVAHGYPPITGGMDFSIVRAHEKVVKAKGDKFRRGKLTQEQQAREGRLDPATQIVDTAVKPKPSHRASTVKVVKK